VRAIWDLDNPVQEYKEPFWFKPWLPHSGLLRSKRL